MMTLKKNLSMAVLTCLSLVSHAQKIVTSDKIEDWKVLSIGNLDEVNARLYKPDGYEEVVNPKLPEPLQNMLGLSIAERAEMLKKRALFNPYLVFDQRIDLQKEGIFIGFSNSWMRLSQYYKYNSDTSSVEAYRQKVNQNILGKKMIGFGPQFEFLENVQGIPRKLINADTVFIYDTKLKYKFKDSLDNYGALIVHLVKFDLGYVTLRYYYPLHQRDSVLREINQTWGIIRFKPDGEFKHPNHKGRMPKGPDLYFGKYSFLNDPEQVRREQKEFELRKLKGKGNALAGEAIRFKQAKRFDQAKEKFFEALSLDEDNLIAYQHLFLMSMDENKRDDSQKYLNALLAKDKKKTEALFFKGLFYKKFNEPDSAIHVFETITRETDPRHFKSFVELAILSVLKGDREAADRNFNLALDVFKTEGEKSQQREGHKIFNINDLFWVRVVYAAFLNNGLEFDKSKWLFEQTLREEEAATEAEKKGERQSIYGKLTPASLGELNFMLAISYAGLRDEINMRVHLEKAKRLGKVLPAELGKFLEN